MNKNIKKSILKIKLNQEEFVRIHKHVNNDLVVYFKNNKKFIKIKNPFNIGFSNFIKKKQNNNKFVDKQLKISELFFKLLSC